MRTPALLAAPLGFDGLSFEYIASRLAALGPEWKQRRTVVAHLGNGASLCALHDGKSRDTTMGLTPLDGLVMRTRCRAIDPGVPLYLMQEEKMSADEVAQRLYEKSGLLGVSADMRTLLASQETAAREAIDLFAFRAAEQVTVMANTLAGLELSIAAADSKVDVLVIATTEETNHRAALPCAA